MPTLDTLLHPLHHVTSPLLPATLSSLLLLFSTFSTTTPTLSTLLYYSNIYTLLTVLLSLSKTFNTYLSNLPHLERDGLAAVWHAVLSEGKMRVKSRSRVVEWREEVVLVTGARGGLGVEIVREVVRRGGRVAGVDVVGCEGEVRGEEGVGEEEKEEVEDKEKKVRWYKCDVGDAKAVEALKERVQRDLGTPTILINNAGITNSKPLLELTAEDVERTFRVNTLSHFNTIRTFLPGMLKREGGGSIVTVSSVLGYLGCAGLTDYTASKSALLALHTSLLSELAFLPPHPHGAQNGPISLILATPGQLATPLFAHLPPPPLARFAAPTVQPRELAEKIVDAIESGGRDVRVSAPLYAGVVAAGVWGLLPTGVARLLRGVVGVDVAGWGGVVERRKREGL